MGGSNKLCDYNELSVGRALTYACYLHYRNEIKTEQIFDTFLASIDRFDGRIGDLNFKEIGFFAKKRIESGALFSGDYSDFLKAPLPLVLRFVKKEAEGYFKLGEVLKSGLGKEDGLEGAVKLILAALEPPQHN